MKNLFKIVAAAGLAFTMASCGAANDVYGNNYPNNPNGGVYRTPDGTVYRTPDGTVYRQGDVYRDRNGNVYQNGRVVRSGDVYGRPGIITGTNRNQDVYYPRNNQRLPPGQAKKVYGGNAKDYAPGQLKKRNANWNGNNSNTTWRNNDDDDRRYNKEDGKFHDKHEGKKHNKGKGKRK